MTFWDSASHFFGIGFGEVSRATAVTGIYTLFLLGVLGTVLGLMGGVAVRVKLKPEWMGPFSLALAGIAMMLLGLIPGFPLLAIIGIIAGIFFVIAAALLHFSGISVKSGPAVAIVVGTILDIGTSVLLLIEIYGGGGLLV